MRLLRVSLGHQGLDQTSGKIKDRVQRRCIKITDHWGGARGRNHTACGRHIYGGPHQQQEPHIWWPPPTTGALSRKQARCILDAFTVERVLMWNISLMQLLVALPTCKASPPATNRDIILSQDAPVTTSLAPVGWQRSAMMPSPNSPNKQCCGSQRIQGSNQGSCPTSGSCLSSQPLWQTGCLSTTSVLTCCLAVCDLLERKHVVGQQEGGVVNQPAAELAQCRFSQPSHIV